MPNGDKIYIRRISVQKTEKEVDKMKIAVTHQNSEVFQHFGHCKEFRIYEVVKGK